MERKWTLDRIEFDNETYEVIERALPETLTPAYPLAALRLEQAPAVQEPNAAARRTAFPAAHAILRTDCAEDFSRNQGLTITYVH